MAGGCGLWRCLSGAVAAGGSRHPSPGGRALPPHPLARSSRTLLAGSTGTTGSHLENPLPAGLDPASTAGVRAHVPLPPNVAGIQVTRLRLCSLVTPSGRITLTASANGSVFKWIETTPEGRRERLLKDEKEYEHLLACAFGIRLPTTSSAPERKMARPTAAPTEARQLSSKPDPKPYPAVPE